MQLLWFLFFLQFLIPFLFMVPVPEPVPVPVPVPEQTWSWSLVPVQSYFWSRPWSRSLSRHISGPGHGPGPGQNFWSCHTVTSSLFHHPDFTLLLTSLLLCLASFQKDVLPAKSQEGSALPARSHRTIGSAVPASHQPEKEEDSSFEENRAKLYGRLISLNV